jgi:hypothetical protein
VKAIVGWGKKRISTFIVFSSRTTHTQYTHVYWLHEYELKMTQYMYYFVRKINRPINYRDFNYTLLPLFHFHFKSKVSISKSFITALLDNFRDRKICRYWFLGIHGSWNCKRLAIVYSEGA